MEVAYITVDRFRRYLLKHSKQKSLFTRGDTRFKDTRFCGICGYPLVKYVPKKMVFKTTSRFYKLTLENGNEFLMCYRADSCINYRKKRKAGELVRVIGFDKS